MSLLWVPHPMDNLKMTFRQSTQDRRTLPQIQDRWGTAYTEQSKVRAKNHALIVLRDEEETTVPLHNLISFRLGPGTTLTHEAAKLLSDAGVCCQFVGREGVRHYGTMVPLATSSSMMERQAMLWCHHKELVANRLYGMRYEEDFSPYIGSKSKMGAEGTRVRSAYRQHFGDSWEGRSFDKKSHSQNEQNQCLNHIAQGINSVVLGVLLGFGLSPALGFIHQGDHHSFVWDIKDLYQEKMVIPMAAALWQESQTLTTPIERLARVMLERHIRETDFCEVVAQDVLAVLGDP